MKKIRLTQLDGKLPNIALMRLAAWHKSLGDEVYFHKTIAHGLFEEQYDKVYGSAIFSSTQKKVDAFLRAFPEAVVGGTYGLDFITLEDIGIPADFNEMDYSIYPDFQASIGFSQRGCRLKCKFCVVPRKEGKIRDNQTINEIWRGKPYPKHIHLLDNDFFGSPNWQDRCDEILAGDFAVCFSQGINIRLFNEEQAAVLAKLNFRDTKFKSRKIYTAWDNHKDEDRFFRGIKILRDAGINPSNIMAYMLVGYHPKETLEDVLYRVEKMKEWKIDPYPMVFQSVDNPKKDRTMAQVQRWVRTGLYRKTSFYEYKPYCG